MLTRLGAVLILVITTREHRYTHRSLYGERGLDVEVVSYDRVLNRKVLQKATHVFTDLDRLSNWQLHEAALLYRRLTDAGIHALNDPARFADRYGLLRGLHHAGINDFNAYRVDSLERPSRWPVFLRLEGNHAAPVSPLLDNQEELEKAIETAVEQGAPRSATLIIEYAAEPVRPGLYRKLSVFRVGDRLLGYTCVHDDNWLVKYGKFGITPPDLYDEEYRLIVDNTYAAAVKPAFDLAGIEYGRVDFGLLGGKPQIYEINSNPHLNLRPTREIPQRRKPSLALFRTNYIDAMNAIDSTPRPAWRAASAFALRTLEALPARAIHFAGNAAAHLRKPAGRDKSQETGPGLQM